MEQAATLGGLGPPCTPEQVLALYQHLFRCPGGQGQLRAVLRQVREEQHQPQGGRQAADSPWRPRGLELPSVLLELERRRRAQEQLLWDLELLTGAGLGLFWPPWAQRAWSWHGESHGRTGGDSAQPMSGSPRLCSPPQAGESLSQNHQLPERAPAVGPLADLDMDVATSTVHPSWGHPSLPAGHTPGCLQELNPTTSSILGEPRSSEDLAQGAERSQAEPKTQSPLHLPSGSLQGRQLAQVAPGPSGLPAQDPLEPQDPPEGLGQERADLQNLLRMEPPQSQRPEAPQGEVAKAQRGEAPQSENREALQGQRGNSPKGQRTEGPLEPRKETPGQETGLQFSDGGTPQAWEVAGGQGPTQPPGEGAPLRPSEDFCGCLGEQVPQAGGRESPVGQGPTQLLQRKTEGHRGESTQAARKLGAAQEGPWAPHPLRRPPAPPTPPPLPGPEAAVLGALSTQDSALHELPAAVPGAAGLGRHAHGTPAAGGGPGPAEQEAGEERKGGTETPKPSRAAWPEPAGREATRAAVSAEQREAALQRLLELHRTAQRRRRQDRERQRLRVLGRLCIAWNRHSRIHPLVTPPLSPAQLPPQEDKAGQRRALREQLEQELRERTRRLRALRARNTQNFQKLLWSPGAEEPVSGEESSPPFPAHF
ncbi:MAP7 domain-containing protein 1-like isoform X2 [Dasypus novemcinctus]|uniref:MAP7 domain-containing protein 1-like isoform X2 n=1 Tax=Dasypus novemcinctus TaxID=9361 RepID=UPI0039C9EEED